MGCGASISLGIGGGTLRSSGSEGDEGSQRNTRFVCGLGCHEEEGPLALALQPWVGVETGPALWTELEKGVCEYYGGVTNRQKEVVSVRVAGGRVYRRCCPGKRGRYEPVQECRGNAAPLHEGDSETTDAALILSIVLEVARETDLPDVAFSFQVGESVATEQAYWAPAPLVHFVAARGYWTVPFPSLDHLRAHALGQLGDAHKALNSASIEWEDRDDRLFWRGRVGRPVFDVPEALELLPPLRLLRLAQEDPELFDVALVDGDALGPALGEELARHKFVLDISEGPGRPPRHLASLLASGAVVFLQEGTSQELAAGWLEAWVHYVPVRYDLGDLVPKLRWFRGDGAAAAWSIAEHSRQRFTTRIRRQDTYCYVWRLLTSLAGLAASPGPFAASGGPHATTTEVTPADAPLVPLPLADMLGAAVDGSRSV